MKKVDLNKSLFLKPSLFGFECPQAVFRNESVAKKSCNKVIKNCHCAVVHTSVFRCDHLREMLLVIIYY